MIIYILKIIFSLPEYKDNLPSEITKDINHKINLV